MRAIYIQDFVEILLIITIFIKNIYKLLIFLNFFNLILYFSLKKKFQNKKKNYFLFF